MQKCFPIPNHKMLKTPINTNISPILFKIQRNHQAKNRAPPQNGGGADKQREFGEILGDIKKWFRMV